jgi:hypothetical protein
LTKIQSDKQEKESHRERNVQVVNREQESLEECEGEDDFEKRMLAKIREVN